MQIYKKSCNVKTHKLYFFLFFLSQKRQNMYMELLQILNRTTSIITMFRAKKRFSLDHLTLNFMVQVFDKVQPKNPQLHLIYWIITTQHHRLTNASGSLGKKRKSMVLQTPTFTTFSMTDRIKLAQLLPQQRVTKAQVSTQVAHHQVATEKVGMNERLDNMGCQ